MSLHTTPYSLFHSARLWTVTLLLAFFAWSLQAGCSTPPANEPAPEPTTKADASTPEPQPEVVQEAVPEEMTVHPKVGQSCRRGPNGDTCDEKFLLCVPVSNTASICVQNCTSDGRCPKGEICRIAHQGFKACIKVVKAGEKCDKSKRLHCAEDFADPPEYCIGGTCKKQPKEGWGLGERCTEPRSGSKQSDCKKGMVCLPLVKGDFRCLQACNANADCPKGEVCWDEPLGHKVCLVPAKEKEVCDRAKRRFCKSDDPQNKPLECKEGKCESKGDFKKEGDFCKVGFGADKRGNCRADLWCVGVSEFKAICHKPCKANSDCKSGEECLMHPNYVTADKTNPVPVCVVPRTKDQDCDIMKRKLCKNTSSMYLKCKESKCVQINIGDGCKTPADCGSMSCVPIDGNQPDIKYCLLPCTPGKTKCPGNGFCQAFVKDGPTVCVPTGPKGLDERCAALKAGGGKLNTTNSCKGGTLCFPLTKSGSGVCAILVGPCKPNVCTNKHHGCVPLQNGGGLCTVDCSKDPKLCKPGTTCKQVTKANKICVPPA